MERETTERSPSDGGPIWALLALWFAGCAAAVFGAFGAEGPGGVLCLSGLLGAGFFAVLALLLLLNRAERLSAVERFVAVLPSTLLLVVAGLFFVDYRLDTGPLSDQTARSVMKLLGQR
ncbi:MAG: hypothetical protein AAF368_14520 [Planctomycetota bacterium]